MLHGHLFTSYYLTVFNPDAQTLCGLQNLKYLLLGLLQKKLTPILNSVEFTFALKIEVLCVWRCGYVSVGCLCSTTGAPRFKSQFCFQLPSAHHGTQ